MQKKSQCKMFQKTIFILMISICLFAEDEVAKTPQTAMEILLFKTGITLLGQEFEREKNITKQNTQDIENLKRDIKYLLQESLKNKLKMSNDTPITIDEPSTVEKLQEENQKLKEYIQKLETQKGQVIKVKTTLAKVIHDKASIKSTPYQNSELVRYVYRDEVLDIELCNRYDWCKIKNKNEYIPKYKLYFLKANKRTRF